MLYEHPKYLLRKYRVSWLARAKATIPMMTLLTTRVLIMLVEVMLVEVYSPCHSFLA